MTNSINPYVLQILEQGRDCCNNPAPQASYPRTIYGRTFNTEEEYLQELHEFLNGN